MKATSQTFSLLVSLYVVLPPPSATTAYDCTDLKACVQTMKLQVDGFTISPEIVPEIDKQNTRRTDPRPDDRLANRTQSNVHWCGFMLRAPDCPV
jgi:hypothetical protein